MSEETLLSVQPSIEHFVMKESHDYEMRITCAMYKPPIDGILAVNGDFLPFFNIFHHEIDQACLDHNACAHGYENHTKRVAANALFLGDIINKGIYQNGKTILEPGVFMKTYSDAEIIFPALIHDAVYRIKGMPWVDYSIEHHEERTPKYLERIRKNIFPKLIGIGNESTEVSLDILQKQSSIYLKTVGKNTKDLINDLEQLTKYEKLTAEMLFPYVVMVGDKFDYYGENRLIGLAEEESNAFFKSAKIVKKYMLSSNEKNITFIVTLDGMSFEEWYKGTCELYPDVWRLGRGFAKLLGREFSIQET